jgi:phospholipid N-methyltransferase
MSSDKTYTNKVAVKFYSVAKTLQKEIDNKFAKRLENTNKRKNEAETAREEGRKLKLLQANLYTLAEMHENNTVPETLTGIDSKTLLDTIMRRPQYPDPKYSHNADFIKQLNKTGIKTEEMYIAAKADLEGLGNQKVAEKTDEEKIRELEVDLIGRKIDGFFPTPATVIEKMIAQVSITSGMTILEPSAGNGNILDAIRKYCTNNSIENVTLHACEVNYNLRNILEAKGYHIIASDCLTLTPENGLYDLILMNPPFERKQDIHHVKAMYELLKPGGKLVSVMTESAFVGNDNTSKDFQRWYIPKGHNISMGQGAFMDRSTLRQTGVNTRILILKKPQELSNELSSDNQTNELNSVLEELFNKSESEDRSNE